MKILVGIPFVNRLDLFKRALDCVPRDICVVGIQNNSGEAADGIGGVPIEDPIGFPLSYSQSMNAFQVAARRNGIPFWFYLHSDGVAQREDFERVIATAEEATKAGKRWATIFTHYDVLGCYNTAAVEEIGLWNLHFPNYFTDNDWYRRAKLKGFELLQLTGHTVEHGVEGKGSQTINSDPALLTTNSIMFPAYAQLYHAMWGGEPGKETFETPWNR